MTEFDLVYRHLLDGNSIDPDTARAVFGINYLNSQISALKNKSHVPIECREIERPHWKTGVYRTIKEYFIPHDERLALDQEPDQVKQECCEKIEQRRRQAASKAIQGWIRLWGVKTVLSLLMVVLGQLEQPVSDELLAAIKKEAQR